MNDKQRRKVQIEIKRLSKTHTGYLLKIEKESPHEIYPTKPNNMSNSKWETLYKPQYVVKQANNPNGGMAYFREKTMNEALVSKKFLERKWQQDMFDKDPQKYS